VANIGQTILVLTKKNPWVIQGTTPAVMGKTRMDYTLTCSSKRGVVNMGYGVVFPTPGGLAVYSMSTGGDLLTKSVLEWDTWGQVADDATLLAAQYNGRYLATSDNGSFMFERDEQTGGYLVRVTQPATAMYYDQFSAEMYHVRGGQVYKFDAPAAEFDTFDWKSKTFVLPEPTNFGAARVLADYGASAADAAIAAQNAVTQANNALLISTGRTRGMLAGNAFGQVTLGGSAILPMRPLGVSLQFQLYVNKELIFSTQLVDSKVFRLPTGYRSDTFEVRVNGNARLRAVHIASTPIELKTK